MSNDKTCAHPACNCKAESNRDYCSNTCEDAKDIIELTCQCNHPGCTEQLA